MSTALLSYPRAGTVIPTTWQVAGPAFCVSGVIGYQGPVAMCITTEQLCLCSPQRIVLSIPLFNIKSAAPCDFAGMRYYAPVDGIIRPLYARAPQNWGVNIVHHGAAMRDMSLKVLVRYYGAAEEWSCAIMNAIEAAVQVDEIIYHHLDYRTR